MHIQLQAASASPRPKARGGERVLAKAAAAARAKGVKAQILMPEIMGGPAAAEIVRQAKKVGADLIVLGTHGRRGMKRLALGSDAENVVRNSKVPVLLVRAG
jgi:nucleotide-binding universal stress UspA family protein